MPPRTELAIPVEEKMEKPKLVARLPAVKAGQFGTWQSFGKAESRPRLSATVTSKGRENTQPHAEQKAAVEPRDQKRGEIVSFKR